MSVEFLELLNSTPIRSISVMSMIEPISGIRPSILEPTPTPSNIEPITVVHEFNQYDIYPYPHPLFGVM